MASPDYLMKVRALVLLSFCDLKLLSSKLGAVFVQRLIWERWRILVVRQQLSFSLLGLQVEAIRPLARGLGEKPVSILSNINTVQALVT